MNCLVSVIVPLYNKANTVERALDSVLTQTYPKIEIIVINDGSADGSEKIVEQKFPNKNIKLIHQENKGPGAARNRGLKEANGEYVAFLDADDKWYPNHIEKSINWLKKHNDIRIVGSMYFENNKFSDMTKHWARRGVVDGIYEIGNHLSPEQVESLILFFHVGNTVIQKDTALKYGGFYEDFCTTGEDTIFFMRILINEKFGIIRNLAVCHHRENSELSNIHKENVCPIIWRHNIISDYCPKDKWHLLELAISRLALRTAHHKARAGYKKLACEILQANPNAKRFALQYWQCKYEILLSYYFKYWTALKRLIAPPIKRNTNRLLCIIRRAKKNEY